MAAPDVEVPPAAGPPADPEVRAIAAERLTFFADAVIAIAITLLALELRRQRAPPMPNC